MTLSARFRVALADFTLDVELNLPGKGVTAIFGASGSGKTTLLRCVAGLSRARSGYLGVNGEVWQDDEKGIFLPTHRRPLGYVSQEANLFPHLSVKENLVYGMKRVPASARAIAPAHVTALLGIGHLAERHPDTLSGGERQRVAIARALLTSPRLLLMDEPLAALDAPRKAEILPYLESLQREFSIPILYVSHAADEVARLADTLVLLDTGRATAVGPTAELLSRLDLPLAHAPEASVVLQTVIAAHDDTFHLTRLDFAGGHLWVPRHEATPGTPLRVRIQARDVSLALVEAKETSVLNILPANIVQLAPEGAGRTLVRLSLCGVPLLARISDKSATLLELAPGKPVFVQIKAISIL